MALLRSLSILVKCLAGPLKYEFCSLIQLFWILKQDGGLTISLSQNPLPTRFMTRISYLMLMEVIIVLLASYSSFSFLYGISANLFVKLGFHFRWYLDEPKITTGGIDVGNLYSLFCHSAKNLAEYSIS